MHVRLSEVLAALSHALDVTEGQPRGHAERTCLIAMRIADELGVDAATRASLHHAALLKDAGCSSNAAKIAALYGDDDQAVKRDRKVVDHLRPAEQLRHLARHVAPGGSPARKVVRLGQLAAFGSSGARSLFQLRCERGADIARSVGLDAAAATAIHQLDEHWDGRGYPAGLAGEAISLGGRILGLAQTAEVFWQDGGGAEAACAVARERRGTWFDPQVVDALCAVERDTRFWASLHHPDVATREPADRVLAADDGVLDRVAEAFARVVDAKSPYTGRHSAGVTEIAVALGAALGMSGPELRDLRRAALLHDIGKLGVSNRILDKPGKLDADEWAQMRRHPELTLQILRRVPALGSIAEVAAAHHERLDGSGYFRGVAGDALSRPARILAVADVAEALTADRPYRAGMEADAALALMGRDAGRALDADALLALEAVLPAWLAGSRTAAAA